MDVTKNNLIECSIVSKNGAREEVESHVNDFFIIRNLAIPKIQVSGDIIKLCVPLDQAESLAVVLDVSIPDLLEPSGIEGHGKIGFTEKKLRQKDIGKNDRRVLAKV